MEDRITGRFEKSRVKHIAVHKKEPLAIVGIYNGEYELWNTKSASIVKSGSIGKVPIRACAFIEEQECFVLGSDDGMLRMFCLDSFELKRKIQAHNDFIRAIAVHPTLPYIATCSDDNTISIWDYSKELSPIRTLSGHTHYVMSLCFSPKDNRVLISCSMDHDIRIWNIESGLSIGTLSGPKSGLNTLVFLSEKLILSGGDEGKIYLWDYTQNTLLNTFSAHSGSVTSIYPTARGFLTTGEDGVIREWEKKRYRPEASLSARLQRVWSVAQSSDGTILGGGDDGLCFIKKSASSTLFTFRASGANARMVICEDTTIKQVKSTNPSAQKILSTLAYSPDRISLSESGRYLAVEIDGEVHIYTLLGFLLQVSVPGSFLVWTGSEDFILVYDGGLVQYTDFEVDKRIKMERKENIEGFSYISEDLYLISTEKGKIIVSIKNNIVTRIKEVGDVLHVCLYHSFYLLVYTTKVVLMHRESGEEVSSECKVVSWCAKDSLFVMYNGMRIVYLVLPKEIVPKKLFFMPIEASVTGKCLLIGITEVLWYIDGDKVCSQKIEWELVDFQSKVLSGALPDKCPENFSKSAVHFLIGLEMLSEAKKLTNDPDEKYELLVRMGNLNEAIEVADSQAKFTALSNLFVKKGDFVNGLKCATKGNSVGNEVILSALCNEMKELKIAARKAAEQGEGLMALVAAYQAGEVEFCRSLLESTPFKVLFDQFYK